MCACSDATFTVTVLLCIGCIAAAESIPAQNLDASRFNDGVNTAHDMTNSSRENQRESTECDVR